MAFRKQQHRNAHQLPAVAPAAEPQHASSSSVLSCYSSSSSQKQALKVIVRVRPPNSCIARTLPPLPPQHDLPPSPLLATTITESTVTIPKPYHDSATKSYSFDRVFGPVASQADVFAHVEPLLCDVLAGRNVSVFAYGQTGSGKTHTMNACAGGRREHDGEAAGITYRAVDWIFDRIARGKLVDARVCVSFMEIYNDEVYDLLPRGGGSSNNGSGGGAVGELRKLKVMTAGRKVTVIGLDQAAVADATAFAKLFEAALRQRSTAGTKLNVSSSRSHFLVQLTVSHVETPRKPPPLTPTSVSSAASSSNTASTPTSKAAAAPPSPPPPLPPHASTSRAAASASRELTSKLALIDLAGSEDNRFTGNQGDRFEESRHINASLFAIRSVVSALKEESNNSNNNISSSSNNKPIPYRNSKITQLLSDSLGGTASSLAVVCCSPEMSDLLPTHNSLEFASHCCLIRNNVVVNEVRRRPAPALEGPAAGGAADKKSLRVNKENNDPSPSITSASSDRRVTLKEAEILLRPLVEASILAERERELARAAQSKHAQLTERILETMNNAPPSQLRQLKMIGPQRAGMIVKARENGKAFESVGDLQRIGFSRDLLGTVLQVNFQTPIDFI
ncbi:Kinesin-like protein kif22 [Geranomyces variabilis]|uniref:Kinesin-like protein n=1 Tax=Geranomyces variabilis TaxID=109894 RepID=A0AAD5XLX2_9FUNG|nr:Kinesin-like protein kif22 [Geranomyces variabilis]